jgi:PAS domain S-box-containing protein
MLEDGTIDMGVLFDDAPTAQMVFRPDLHVVAANRRYCAMLGIARRDLVGKRVFDAFPANPDDPGADAEEELQASSDRVVETGEPHELPLRQHDVLGPDGRYAVRYWRVVNSPVFADPGDPSRVTHIIHTAEDVTRSVLGDRVDEAKRRSAMRGADIAYFEYDPDLATISISPQLNAMFGFPAERRENAIGPFQDRVHPEDRPGMEVQLDRVARTVGSELQLDYRVQWPDGSIRWILGRGESIRNPETQGVLIVGVVLDLTPIREGEERLREAVAARDLLIAEVNHRVKNSLQMVTSILNLEAQGMTDPTAQAALAAATARVRAVAAIHASLYEDDDVQSVQIDRYLHRLCEHLRVWLASAQGAVRIVLDIEPMRVPTDTAVTLSLAVNELVTNSFKHGAWDTGGGTVAVLLHRHGDDRIMLEVADDATGVAAKPALPAPASPGLGKRLIAGMAAQLSGAVEEDHTAGWRTRIVFPG